MSTPISPFELPDHTWYDEQLGIRNFVLSKFREGLGCFVGLAGHDGFWRDLESRGNGLCKDFDKTIHLGSKEGKERVGEKVKEIEGFIATAWDTSAIPKDWYSTSLRGYVVHCLNKPTRNKQGRLYRNRVKQKKEGISLKASRVSPEGLACPPGRDSSLLGRVNDLVTPSQSVPNAADSRPRIHHQTTYPGKLRGQPKSPLCDYIILTKRVVYISRNLATDTDVFEDRVQTTSIMELIGDNHLDTLPPHLIKAQHLDLQKYLICLVDPPISRQAADIVKWINPHDNSRWEDVTDQRHFVKAISQLYILSSENTLQLFVHSPTNPTRPITTGAQFHESTKVGSDASHVETTPTPQQSRPIRQEDEYHESAEGTGDVAHVEIGQDTPMSQTLEQRAKRPGSAPVATSAKRSRTRKYSFSKGYNTDSDSLDSGDRGLHTSAEEIKAQQSERRLRHVGFPNDDGCGIYDDSITPEPWVSVVGGAKEVIAPITTNGEHSDARVANPLDTILAGDSIDLNAMKLVGDESSSEEDEEDNLKKSDLDNLEERQRRLDLKLAEAADSRVTERVDKDKWEEFCDFVGHDIGKYKPQDGVAIYGMNPDRLPRPHQLVLACEALISSKQQSGLIIADVTGTGKTTSVILIFVLLRQIALMYDEVEKARSSRESALHLKEGIVQNPESPIGCPSKARRRGYANQFHLSCPCVPGSFLDKYGIRPQHGTFLSLVPQNILTVWMREWSNCLCPTEAGRIGLRLVVAHSVGDNTEYDFARLTTQGKKDIHADVHTINAPSKENNGRGRYQISGRLPNTRFLIVSTSHSISKFWEANFVKKLNHVYVPRGRIRPVTVPVEQFTDLAFSMIARDELHKEFRSTSKTIQVLDSHVVKQSNPCILPMSATPFEFGPNDIAEYVRVMARSHGPKGGFDTPRLRGCTHKNMMELHQVFESLKTDRKMSEDDRAKNLDDVLEQMTGICNTLMIRRTQDTDFFGERIVQIPPNRMKDIPLPSTDDPTLSDELSLYEAKTNEEVLKAYQRRVKEARKYGRPQPKPLNSGAAKFHKLRQMVSFPHLVKMFNTAKLEALAELEDPQFDALKLGQATETDLLKSTKAYLGLTQEQVEAMDWYKNPSSSPFFPAIEELASSSTKLGWIKMFWLKIKDDTDVEGFPSQVILTSYFAVNCVILYLCLTKIMGIPTAHVAFVHPQLSRALRTAKFDAFQRELDDSGGLKYKPVRIILAPLTSIAEGITLTKAKYCILLEPQYKMMMEVQLFGRHGRIGQKNPVTHSFRLYVNDGIESKIMAKHEHRKQLVPAMSQTIKDRQQLEPKKRKQSTEILYIDLEEA